MILALPRNNVSLIWRNVVEPKMEVLEKDRRVVFKEVVETRSRLWSVNL